MELWHFDALTSHREVQDLIPRTKDNTIGGCKFDAIVFRNYVLHRSGFEVEDLNPWHLISKGKFIATAIEINPKYRPLALGNDLDIGVVRTDLDDRSIMEPTVDVPFPINLHILGPGGWGFQQNCTI